MRVLLCAGQDYANLGSLLSQSLQSVGCLSDMYKLYNHKFEYEQEGNICSINKICEIIKCYDVIIFMHSGENILFSGSKLKYNTDILKIIKKYKHTKVFAVLHGGSLYRRIPNKINKIVNPLIDITLTQTYDLLGLGAKNEQWLLAPVNTSALQYDFDTKYPLIISHYPSKVSVKNSSMINETIGSICNNEKYNKLFVYKYSPNRVKHKENIKRMKECDIYIDHQMFYLGNKKYGEFGITTTEAAALGKVVITCTNGINRYNKEYGSFVPFISRSKEDLTNIVVNLINTDANKITKLKQKHRAWVEKNHSYKSIGLRLFNMLQKTLLKKNELIK